MSGRINSDRTAGIDVQNHSLFLLITPGITWFHGTQGTGSSSIAGLFQFLMGTAIPLFDTTTKFLDARNPLLAMMIL